jgi:MoxR-like ATPase
VFLFDEIDGSLAGAVIAFNAALANRVADFPCGQREAHPDFIAVAAANTYGHGATRDYVGRNPLDGATLDRFGFIAMDYDEHIENAMTDNTEWLNRVRSVRKATRSLSLQHIISPRATQKGAKFLAAGMAQEKVEQMYLWKGLDQPTIDKIEAAA